MARRPQARRDLAIREDHRPDPMTNHRNHDTVRNIRPGGESGPGRRDAPSQRDALPNSYDGLRLLQEEFRRYQVAAFPFRPSRFFALELAGETGELANLEKKAWKGRHVPEEDFADESADVCIALLNFANSRDIDLAHAVEEKMRRIDRRRRAGPETSENPGDA